MELLVSPFPQKEALEELFTNSSLDGTNSGNSISNNDVWWHQDYWYRSQNLDIMTVLCGLLRATKTFLLMERSILIKLMPQLFIK